MFIVLPEVRRYTDVDRCWSYLAESIKSLDFQIITSHEDICLDAAGRLIGSPYRLSWLAFQQLCSYAANGLSKLLVDLIGIPKQDDVIVSQATAIQIFNSCTRLRFNARDGIYQKKLMRFGEGKTIEGVVNVSYRHLPNWQLLESSLSQFPQAEFIGGTLVGKRFGYLLKIHQDPLETSMGPVYGCLYIGNSEVGECGVRASAAIVPCNTSQRLLVRMHYVSHTGNRFRKRVSGLLRCASGDLDRLLKRWAEWAKHMEISLDLISDDAICDKRHAMWVRRLVQYGVPRYVAAAGVCAVECLNEDPALLPARNDIESIKKRTVGELSWNLLSFTDGKPFILRERVEPAVFRLIDRLK